MREIHQFYAVTQSRSLYRVSDECDPETHVPTIEKISLLGESQCPVGTRFTGGSLVGITPDRLLLFHNDGHYQTAHMVNTRFWGGATSPIIGLFEDKKTARQCLNSADLKPWDSRWTKETGRVLLLIGSRHPIFKPEPELLSRVGIVDPQLTQYN